jgi:U4/U6 small nuclear ribonucleoprotein PRP4
MMSSSHANAPGGNSNVADQVEVMELTSASQAEWMQHQQLQLDLEAKSRAFSMVVPTLVHEVRSTLRQMGLPVRLFGENLANVRDRLRLELARREIQKERGLIVGAGAPITASGDLVTSSAGTAIKQEDEDEEEEITKYSRASPELIRAREQFAQFSLERSRLRLDRERNYRLQWQRKRSRFLSSMKGTNNNDDGKDEDEQVEEYADVTRLDEMCIQTYKSLRNIGLEGSQYGDARPLSAMCTSRFAPNSATTTTPGASNLPIIATGSWSGTIKLWDGSSPELQLISEKTMAHEDRIMGVALKPYDDSLQQQRLLATASIDTTAKLWKVLSPSKDTSTMTGDGSESSSPRLNIEEVAHLKGHARRLCKVAFHPQGRHVATTSFDHTWRLWDCETGGEILLQDGHWKEVYGIGFHPDGSICSTTDYGSVVQLWDLRTGKSIHHFLGHARRVLCAEFSPNGFQLATAGDDGTIKVWDLRKRKQFVSLPAHSNLITQLRFDSGIAVTGSSSPSAAALTGGEYLVSSSFDGTAKVWSARDWKLLSTLRGHEGKVMAVDILPQQKSIVTCGFDKTLKLWR